MEAYLDKILQPEVLATLLAVFVFARATAGGGQQKRGPASPPPTQAEIDAAIKRVTLSKWLEIDAELAGRKKINAIKLLRDASGLSLKDAKNAIEARIRQRGMGLH